MTYTNILTDKKGKTGVITLNRPQSLNALCDAMMREVVTALDAFAADNDIAVIVLTGSEKAFAAGADIKEIAPKTFTDMYQDDFVERTWEHAARMKKPVIAAVSGYCLGGGCELAMMCDFIIASESAKFGQPEITIGTLPGAGGTQRLTRAIGKAKAMEMCLTGRMMDAREAEAAGLVARVVPAAAFMEEVMKTADKIGGYSKLAAAMVKEAVNNAQETSLSEGLRFERKLFHASFSTHDQKEGMAAFAEKRPAQFKDK